jgi:phosphoribosyl 1,2-cyclic phosphodiesterase
MNTTAMELTFLGKRGEIDVRSRWHRRHSSLLVEYDSVRIMIDCGADWLGRVRTILPTAIVLTHAHPDHAAGLADGAPCPVYATQETSDLLHRFSIRDRRSIPLGRSVTIGGVRFKAYQVKHSVRAPAVGYRVSANGGCFFYVPDVAALPKAAEALRRINVYIGDGASLNRSMVRKKSATLIGHASIAAQLRWCESAGVSRAIFTHCGSGIVRGPLRQLDAEVRRLGWEHGVDAKLARDGDRLSFAAAENAARRTRC